MARNNPYKIRRVVLFDTASYQPWDQAWEAPHLGEPARSQQSAALESHPSQTGLDRSETPGHACTSLPNEFSPLPSLRSDGRRHRASASRRNTSNSPHRSRNIMMLRAPVDLVQAQHRFVPGIGRTECLKTLRSALAFEPIKD